MAVAVRILNLSTRRDHRSDKALVRAAQAGKQEAVAALIQRHYPRVYSFVSYLSSGTGAADDLTQEVFTRALSALPRFNGQYQFEPWLLKIARNLVIDEARRDLHRASPTDPQDLPNLEPVASASDHVWESMSQQLAGSLVKRALQNMPMRQRTVLVLREIEGLSYADIAQIIGTNTRGVEATLRRARARFRLEIAKTESEESARAVCQRTLRAVASESSDGDSLVHLARCKQCRSKATAIRSADKLFAFLPPLALPTDWHLDATAALQPSPTASVRSLMQTLRSPHLGMAGPLAQIAEMAAVIVMAGAVTVSSAAGQLSRSASIALAAPPAFEAPVIESPFERSQSMTPEFAVIDPAPQSTQAEIASEKATPEARLTDLLAFPFDDPLSLDQYLISHLNADHLVSLEQQMASALDSAQLREIADSMEGAAANTLPRQDSAIPLEGDLPVSPSSPDAIAATPVPVTLPRRRSFTSKA